MQSLSQSNEPAGSTSQNPIGANPRPASRHKLLVVDDQAVNIQALYHAFAEDHQVFVATCGTQAIRLCREKQPDLVLLDIVMPEMDGYEVCTALKAKQLPSKRRSCIAVSPDKSAFP